MAESLQQTLLLLTGILLAGAVVGVWLTLARLALATVDRTLPDWMPWVIACITMLVGMVIIGGQIMMLSVGAGSNVVALPSQERAVVAIVAVLLSPAWVMSAALAAFGLVLHYTVDDLLAGFALKPFATEGVALGFRLAWMVIGLLVLVVGLENSYQLAQAAYHTSLAFVLSQIGSFSLTLRGIGLFLGVFGMVSPSLMRDSKTKRSEAVVN